MTTTERRAAIHRFHPEIGRRVSVWLVRAGIAVLLVALCVSAIGETPYLIVALLLVGVALAFPRTPAAWVLAILLAVLTLGPVDAGPSWRSFVVLAGAHALHQFGMLLAWLPVRGHIQLRILGRMLRSYLLIQIPAQLISVVVLNLLSGTSATFRSPVFGIVASLGLLLLVTLVLVPMRFPRRTHQGQ
jgi:hypothetical protein